MSTFEEECVEFGCHEPADACSHPFDECVYVGRDFWACSLCGALIDGALIDGGRG